ncbi:ferredoxin [Candidatus Synechococcus spongiarum]|uniref:ferredoxin n=1 Tax=Candidatus Synechococcus spongiarum TaxID=431041 RepID=UPI0027E3BEEE|nr:ferredoxin [Candidatus Synechococcus spongiarum]
MASPRKRRPENASGPFYVDSSCIDCGACWQWDPQHFEDHGHQARVRLQPQPGEETERALMAAQACPVAAIGAPPNLMRQTPSPGFPALITRHPAGTCTTAAGVHGAVMGPAATWWCVPRGTC